MRNASGHQGENERQRNMQQTKRNRYKISSLIKHVTRKFHVVVMQNNNREMYKKVCCISKVVFCWLWPTDFFVVLIADRHLVLRDFIFCLSISILTKALLLANPG